MKITDTIISPIFYMGNKKKLINKGLTDYFPDNIRVFVDVFAGSSIVGMNVKADKHIVNDSDSNLVKLYELFKTNSVDKIISHINSRIDEYGLARERTKRNEFKDKDKIEEYKASYMNFRKQYNENPDVLDFYTLMFYSFSQQFRFNNKGEFNMPCGNDCFAPKNEEYIRNGCDFFSQTNTKIYNKDFRELLKVKKYPDNIFFYFDPPYLGTTATYNENNGWNEQDESDLYAELEKLSANNVKWAMSNVINNKGKVNQMLIDWSDSHNYNVHTFDGFTYMACGKGNSEAKEVLITNY